MVRLTLLHVSLHYTTLLMIFYYERTSQKSFIFKTLLRNSQRFFFLLSYHPTLQNFQQPLLKLFTQTSQSLYNFPFLHGTSGHSVPRWHFFFFCFEEWFFRMIKLSNQIKKREWATTNFSPPSWLTGQSESIKYLIFYFYFFCPNSTQSSSACWPTNQI